MYGVSVIMLISVLYDERVELFEAVALVAAYGFYITGEKLNWFGKVLSTKNMRF